MTPVTDNATLLFSVSVKPVDMFASSLVILKAFTPVVEKVKLCVLRNKLGDVPPKIEKLTELAAVTGCKVFAPVPAIISLPIVCVGTLEMVIAAPAMDKTSFVAGAVRVGFQLEAI